MWKTAPGLHRDPFVREAVTRLRSSDASQEMRLIFEERACQLTGQENIRLKLIRGNRSSFERANRTLDLNADVCFAEVSEAEMIVQMHAELWHEVGHVLHSEHALHAPTKLTDVIGLNVLEDGRMERQLIRSHPEARSWLRRNLIGGSGYVGWLVNQARSTPGGWYVYGSMVGTRGFGGVVSGEEVAEVIALGRRDGVDLAKLEPIWRGYAELGDRAVGGPHAIRYIERWVEYIEGRRS